MSPTRAGRKRSQMQYVRPKQPAEFLPFQHPKLVETPPIGEAWVHEIKFDGYRVQLHVLAGTVRIYTRNGNDWTDKFPEIAADAARLADCILDAELVALDAGGKPDFSRLRSSISPGRSADLVLFVFDLMWGQGEDMRPYALPSRKAVLARILEAAPSTRLRFVSHLETGGPVLLQSACRMGLEGIVSKRRDSTYRAGRSDTWVKAKCRPSQEVVIGGWKQEPAGAFKALLVGVYDGPRLRYAGSVKTGFGGHARGLLERMKALEAEASPFAAGDPPRKTREVHWIKPQLVANVDIAEWTASGKLRQSSFKGLREDKRPEDVVRERPEA